MLMPRKLAEYNDGFNAVSSDLVRELKRTREEKTAVLRHVPDFLFKMSLQCVTYIVNLALGHSYKYLVSETL